MSDKFLARHVYVDPHHVSEDKPCHVVDMPHWGSFETPLGYDYLRRRRLQTIGYHAFRLLLDAIAWFVTTFFLGVKIRGRRNIKKIHGGFVSIANHVQTLDCAMVLRMLKGRRTYFLSLESNFVITCVGQFVRWGGAVPVSTHFRQLHELVASMNEALRLGDAVHVYPETALVPYCDHLRPFATGAFYLAVVNHVPIVLFAITQRPRKGLWKLIKRKPCFTVTCLSPIYPNAALRRVDAVHELAENCWQAMHAVIDA